MYQTAGFNQSAMLFTSMSDGDALCVAHDMTSGSHQVGCDDHARSGALASVFSDRTNLDEAVRVVACRRDAGRKDCRSYNAKERGARSRQKMLKNHEEANSRMRTRLLPSRGLGQGL